MSNVHNYQRRALESLLQKGLAAPVVLKENQQYFLDGEEIFLLGISKGIGTCSDLHGVNIAVFGHTRPKRIQGRPVFPEQCEAAAIIREPTSEEWPDQNSPARIPDNLVVVKETAECIWFVRKGSGDPYVQTIC